MASQQHDRVCVEQDVEAGNPDCLDRRAVGIGVNSRAHMIPIRVDGAVPAAASGAWSPAQRLGFRFLASYFALYILPLDPLWRSVTPYVAANLLGVKAPLSFVQTGSGDTTAAYVRFSTMVVLALIITVGWTVAHRRATAYPRAARWWTVVTRYFLAITMLGYGMAKIIPTQFMMPSLDQLLRTYGESSPMGIVWTFMGLSPAYTIFAGLAEAVGAVLLLFRRTTTLGAAILAAVLANVVMLNFAYDVPVKLFSAHLLAMAIGLLVLDARRLIAVFWCNRPVACVEQRPLFDSVWANRLGRTLAVLAVATMVVMTSISGWRVHTSYGNGRPRPELWGIHDVERFVYDEEERPPLLTDTIRWRALVVDRVAIPSQAAMDGPSLPPSLVVILHMDGRRSYHSVALDEQARTITRVSYGGAHLLPDDVLHYERREAGNVTMRGTWMGRPVEVHMRTRPAEQLLLINRGFRWINEVPFNR